MLNYLTVKSQFCAPAEGGGGAADNSHWRSLNCVKCAGRDSFVCNLPLPSAVATRNGCRCRHTATSASLFMIPLLLVIWPCPRSVSVFALWG